jgi:hypothetical protein
LQRIGEAAATAGKGGPGREKSNRGKLRHCFHFNKIKFDMNARYIAAELILGNKQTVRSNKSLMDAVGFLPQGGEFDPTIYKKAAPNRISDGSLESP